MEIGSEPKKSRSGLRLANVGFEFAAGLVGFVLVGYLADRYFGWQPWGVLTGALLGIVGGLYNLVRSGLSASREAEIEDRAQDSGSGDDDTGRSGRSRPGQ